MVCKRSDADGLIVAYLLAPLIVSALLVGIAYTFNRYIPLFFFILNGGRKRE